MAAIFIFPLLSSWNTQLGLSLVPAASLVEPRDPMVMTVGVDVTASNSSRIATQAAYMKAALT